MRLHLYFYIATCAAVREKDNVPKAKLTLPDVGKGGVFRLAAEDEKHDLQKLPQMTVAVDSNGETSPVFNLNETAAVEGTIPKARPYNASADPLEWAREWAILFPVAGQFPGAAKEFELAANLANVNGIRRQTLRELIVQERACAGERLITYPDGYEELRMSAPDRCVTALGDTSVYGACGTLIDNCTNLACLNAGAESAGAQGAGCRIALRKVVALEERMEKLIVESVRTEYRLHAGRSGSGLVHSLLGLFLVFVLAKGLWSPRAEVARDEKVDKEKPTNDLFVRDLLPSGDRKALWLPSRFGGKGDFHEAEREALKQSGCEVTFSASGARLDASQE